MPKNSYKSIENKFKFFEIFSNQIKDLVIFNVKIGLIINKAIFNFFKFLN